MIKNKFIFVLLLILLPQFVMAANCDYTPLNNRITELENQNVLLGKINQSYSELLIQCNNLSLQYSNLNLSYEQLQKKYEIIKSERDLFEKKYLNTSLGNMTIGDFIVYMTNIENHYDSINQSITTQINQMTTIRNWTIGINITFSLALISITIIFFKYFRKYIITKISEITKIKVRHETKIETK